MTQALLLRGSTARAWCVALALLAPLVAPHPGTAQRTGDGDGENSCPSGYITSIDVEREGVFDPEAASLGLVSWSYRALNLIHVRTSPVFIRGELLFDEGDCYDPFLISESERLLDLYGFLATVRITSEDDGRGGHAVHVRTRDEWSTKLTVGLAYDGGAAVERIQVTEENLLGRGVFASYSYEERRETKSQSVRLATPRLWGRTDAAVEFGQDRPGDFFSQHVRYPFIGEASSYSIRQGFGRGTRHFAYAVSDGEGYNQVLVPLFRETAELSGARRFGSPGESVILGASLVREVVRFTGQPEVILADDFDDLQPLPGPVPEAMTRQFRESSSTRVAVHLGTRRYRYEDYEGIDGLRGRTVVSLGGFAGVSVGKGFDLLTPGGIAADDDLFGRVHGSFGAAVGSSILHGGLTVESRRADGSWRDVLGDADLVAYLRNDDLASHTVFVRASVAGGWNTRLPFQLSLGGRDGVRSLPEDRYPGGRMVRFVVEDRVLFPWPPPGAADLGMTAFMDVGRVWPGSVPYGVESGWKAGVGLGLRIGLPAGTRNVIRTDIAFPVGSDRGGPIFRVNLELNRLISGFYTPEVFRSRRFNLGPEHF